MKTLMNLELVERQTLLRPVFHLIECIVHLAIHFTCLILLLLRWRQKIITCYFVIKGNLFWICFVKYLECNQPDSLRISPSWWRVPWVTMNFLPLKICVFQIYVNCPLLFSIEVMLQDVSWFCLFSVCVSMLI